MWQPEVVDVEGDLVAVSVIDRSGDSFRLRVEVVDAETSIAAMTEFRIVGVEPRLWWVNGLDDVTVDVRSHGLIVRLPVAAGDLEFTPSSY